MDIIAKSLELDEEPSSTATSKKKKKKLTTANAMEHISTDRQGVWKQLRRLSKSHRKDVINKRKTKKKMSALEKYREYHDVDFTESNIEALQLITKQGKIAENIAEKILYKQPNRLARDIKKEEKPKEESI